MEYEPNKENFKKLTKYSHEEIIYHIRLCSQKSLILGVKYYDNGRLITISDLSPLGHEFLSNIRENNIWSKTKESAKIIGSFSLDTLQQIAINIISNKMSNTKF